jgi:hypothetical protein
VFHARGNLFAILLIGACSDGGMSDPGGATRSRAFGLWQPGAFDTCTQEQHDAYAVTGPDGKVYPTWHPPTGPGGCTFGHEHGRDPSGSNLYQQAGGLPFGFANEMRALSDPRHPRDEDHFGHKVEWENGVKLSRPEGGSTMCDVLMKLHQGTHSKDALTNNLHELVFHEKCDDGTELHVTLLAAIGEQGAFSRACAESQVVQVGEPAPPSSPKSLGIRYIPDRGCIEQHMLMPAGQRSNYDPALHERWNTYNEIVRADGRVLAFFNPHFHVLLPSRFYDPAQASIIGRPMDVCYEVTPDGERASGGPCATATADGTIPGITFDDPRSGFKGTERSVRLNVTRISNEGGPDVWYTDALGRNARTQPFEGSIRQELARVDREVGFDYIGPTIGGDRQYAAPGVRAPN